MVYDLQGNLMGEYQGLGVWADNPSNDSWFRPSGGFSSAPAPSAGVAKSAISSINGSSGISGLRTQGPSIGGNPTISVGNLGGGSGGGFQTILLIGMVIAGAAIILKFLKR